MTLQEKLVSTSTRHLRLSACGHLYTGRDVGLRPTPTLHARRLSKCDRRRRFIDDGPPSSNRRDRHGHHEARRSTGSSKIGRASCRERVKMSEAEGRGREKKRRRGGGRIPAQT